MERMYSILERFGKLIWVGACLLILFYVLHGYGILLSKGLGGFSAAL